MINWTDTRAYPTSRGFDFPRDVCARKATERKKRTSFLQMLASQSVDCYTAGKKEGTDVNLVCKHDGQTHHGMMRFSWKHRDEKFMRRDDDDVGRCEPCQIDRHEEILQHSPLCCPGLILRLLGWCHWSCHPDSSWVDLRLLPFAFY